MNGLKYIRTQCNFSLGELAKRLGVSRQMISAWENGKKEISKQRREQLAEFFGIDADFFDDITEEQKRQLLGKAMFRCVADGTETYRYRPGQETDTDFAYFIPERRQSLDEEYVQLQRQQKQLLERIGQMISGPGQASLRDQMAYMNRGLAVFSRTQEAMEYCFSREPLMKMPYYYQLLEILEAVRLAWSDQEISASDEKTGMDGAWVEQLAATIHQRTLSMEDEYSGGQRKTTTSTEGNSVTENPVAKNPAAKNPATENPAAEDTDPLNTDQPHMQLAQRIQEAEELYENMEKPENMKMFAVSLSE